MKFLQEGGKNVRVKSKIFPVVSALTNTIDEFYFSSQFPNFGAVTVNAAFFLLFSIQIDNSAPRYIRFPFQAKQP